MLKLSPPIDPPGFHGQPASLCFHTTSTVCFTISKSELIVDRFPLCRWRKLSTRVKSVAASRRPSRINSANYPGKSRTDAHRTAWCYWRHLSRRGSHDFVDTPPPSPGCWSCTWSDTASTLSCLWTASWASKWSSPGTWRSSPTALSSPDLHLVWAGALKLPRKTSSSTRHSWSNKSASQNTWKNKDEMPAFYNLL